MISSTKETPLDTIRLSTLNSKKEKEKRRYYSIIMYTNKNKIVFFQVILKKLFADEIIILFI